MANIRLNKISISMSVAVTALLTPAVLLAAGGASRQPSLADLKWPWLNFLIYCALLYFILRKPVAAAWQARRAAIDSAVNAAELKNKAMQLELEKAQNLLNSLDEECARISRDIAKEAELESQEIIRSAGKRAERLLTQAQDTVRAERKAAELAIKRELVDLALKQAKLKLATEITLESDRDLRDSALSSTSSVVQ